MANRHLARSIVLQSLFEWDFGNKSYSDAIEIFKRNIGEFAPGISSDFFMEDLMENVLKKRGDLDNIISKAAPDWPIEKISIVDRNVLRIGLYELIFSDRSQVPPKVAINEAIELAKTFGGDTSGKFVNGVLGAVYKEMGEPGKDDKGSKKNQQVSDKKLTVENLGGALIYALDKGQIQIALVHDVFGHWTLSKGGLEEKEDLKSGTKREIKEEMGLDIEIEEGIGENEYITYHPEKGKLKKRVSYFLARSEFVPIKLGNSGGLDNAKWFALTEIDELNFYDDIMPIVIKGVKIIANKKQ